MNEIIEAAFTDFSVDGVEIPVKFLRYEGHGEPYITYQQTDAEMSISADDDLLGYVDHYDFDIYSKGNYIPIIDAVKAVMKSIGFRWITSDTSGDMYETETGYYHKVLSFAIHREEDE